ncbi:MAG TPA: hypothetical protein HPP76_02650 [Desulfuromonadales bacterium]|nr:hypothetical protein [Desulfuromonadales bacterium]
MLSIVVTIMLYGGALQRWWCCDDPQILKHALTYSPWEYFSKPDVWRAMVPYSLTPWLGLTYDLDHTLFGLNPTGYYAHNLLIIAACASLIYLIARQWTDDWHATGGALLFLVGSPVMTASQQLMVRHYVEGLFFYLVAIWLIMRALRLQTDQSGWFAGVAFAIAATAKELYLPVGFVPFLLPIGTFRQRLMVAWPLLLVMLLYVPWRWYMLGDVVGGYTPSGELGRSDFMNALGQFTTIPGMLLVMPWLGVSVVTVATLYLVFRSKKNWWALLLLISLPVLLLTPLIPLARMPGLGAGSERYFIVVWAAVSIGSAVVLGLIAARHTPGIRMATLTALLVLIGSAWLTAHRVAAHVLPTLYEQEVQGRALITSDGNDVIYLTPAVAAWYVTGIIDLRKLYGQTGPPPRLVADEFDLNEIPPVGRHILRFDHTHNTMADITAQVSHDLIKWRKNVRQAPLSVTMSYNTVTKSMNWQLGPYITGSYTFLLESGRQPVPPRGALRIDKPPDSNVFRFRYDDPDGWIAYTPPLRLDQNYRVSWHGTGVPVANR